MKRRNKAAIEHNGLQLNNRGFFSHVVLGAVSGALAFTVKLLKKEKKGWRVLALKY